MSLELSSKTLLQKQGRAPAKADQRITIGEMARTFSVSLRTLRFYEDKGLLVPRREGTTRFYGPRDQARLEKILHGKNLGFTLTEIGDMLVGSDRQPSAKHLELKPEQIKSQIAHLERQKTSIEGAILALRTAQQTRVRSRPSR